MDFAYWPLNVGPKPGGSDDENLGCWTVEGFFAGKMLTVVKLVKL